MKKFLKSKIENMNINNAVKVSQKKESVPIHLPLERVAPILSQLFSRHLQAQQSSQTLAQRLPQPPAQLSLPPPAKSSPPPPAQSSPKPLAKSSPPLPAQSSPPLPAQSSPSLLAQSSPEFQPPLPRDPPPRLPPRRFPQPLLIPKIEIIDLVEPNSPEVVEIKIESQESVNESGRLICKCKHSHNVTKLHGLFCKEFENASCYNPNCKFIHATIYQQQQLYNTGKLPEKCLNHRVNMYNATVVNNLEINNPADPANTNDHSTGVNINNSAHNYNVGVPHSNNTGINNYNYNGNNISSVPYHNAQNNSTYNADYNNSQCASNYNAVNYNTAQVTCATAGYNPVNNNTDPVNNFYGPEKFMYPPPPPPQQPAPDPTYSQVPLSFTLNLPPPPYKKLEGARQNDVNAHSNSLKRSWCEHEELCSPTHGCGAVQGNNCTKCKLFDDSMSLKKLRADTVTKVAEEIASNILLLDNRQYRLFLCVAIVVFLIKCQEQGEQAVSEQMQQQRLNFLQQLRLINTNQQTQNNEWNIANFLTILQNIQVRDDSVQTTASASTIAAILNLLGL